MTPRVGVVVLAAGRSTRFGQSGAHKLLAPLAGVPLVRLSVSAAVDADVGQVVVVTGANAEAVEGALAGLPIRVEREPAFANGMAVSLRRGVTALEPDVDALMISLGDQPGMLAEAYRAVVSRWRTSGSSIVVPRYADASGPAHPTLFASEVFSELLALDGDVGARSVVAHDPSRVTEATLEWRAPRDIDTLDDLDSLLGDFMSARQSAHHSARTGSPPPTNTIP